MNIFFCHKSLSSCFSNIVWPKVAPLYFAFAARKTYAIIFWYWPLGRQSAMASTRVNVLSLIRTWVQTLFLSLFLFLFNNATPSKCSCTTSRGDARVHVFSSFSTYYTAAACQISRLTLSPSRRVGLRWFRLLRLFLLRCRIRVTKTKRLPRCSTRHRVPSFGNPRFWRSSTLYDVIRWRNFLEPINVETTETHDFASSCALLNQCFIQLMENFWYQHSKVTFVVHFTLRYIYSCSGLFGLYWFG